jgi:hypothetical protein
MYHQLSSMQRKPTHHNQASMNHGYITLIPLTICLPVSITIHRHLSCHIRAPSSSAVRTYMLFNVFSLGHHLGMVPLKPRSKLKAVPLRSPNSNYRHFHLHARACEGLRHQIRIGSRVLSANSIVCWRVPLSAPLYLLQSCPYESWHTPLSWHA